jgi:hypothetical protein
MSGVLVFAAFFLACLACLATVLWWALWHMED